MVNHNRRRDGKGQAKADMRVALGLAASLVVLLVGVLFVVRRNDLLQGETPVRWQPTASDERSPQASVGRADSASRRSDRNQRIVATPHRLSGDDAANNGTAREGRAHEMPRLGGLSEAQGPEPLGSLAGALAETGSALTASAGIEDAERNDKNPRKLLKKIRRHVQAGAFADAIETSRQIVELTSSPSQRDSLTTKLDEVESAVDAGQNVDFDSLIDLIKNTLSPNSWDTVGGPGSIDRFPPGIYVDADGLLRHRVERDDSAALRELRDRAGARSLPEDISRPSALRKVSLPRLEREIARRLAAGELLTDDMRYLAGLQQVQYVFVYPDEHDVVLAGPAEGWQIDPWGRAVGSQSGRPTIELDDLVVVLRTCFSDGASHGIFGCGIYPRTERLRQVQEFLAASSARGPIEPAQRDRWLAELRDQLGQQDIRISGVPAGSRVAQVMVEADYRMKLIGIGLEQAAVPGIPNYFDLMGVPDQARLSRALDTLRWWFVLNYDCVLASSALDAFELRGSRVGVLSENELLTVTGDRVHTGRSDPINEQFARNFTEHFSALAERDVNFADLANIFDLAVLGSLLRGQGIPRLIGWSMDCWLDPDEYLVRPQPAPRMVETVINHRVYGGRHIVAVISGGVHVNPWDVAGPGKIQVDQAGLLTKTRTESQEAAAPDGSWWWD